MSVARHGLGSWLFLLVLSQPVDLLLHGLEGFHEHLHLGRLQLGWLFSRLKIGMFFGVVAVILLVTGSGHGVRVWCSEMKAV